MAVAAVGTGLAVRILRAGVLPIAPDDAAYIGVGRRIASLHAPVGIDGTVFTIRSWVWPIMVGTASHLGADPFTGPRVLGVAFGAMALLGVVLLGQRLSGGAGALAVAAALLLTPAVWDLVASSRVDVGLMAMIVLTVLVASRPTRRTAVVAGVLAGLALLVKETSAPLVVLPVAWITPFLPWRRLTRRFLVAFALTVAWWFVVVLVARGEVFPVQGLARGEGRLLPRPWHPDAASVATVIVWIVGAAALLAWRNRDVGIRVLLVAMGALVPAAVVAWHQQLGIRQFAPLGLLGAVVAALGVVEAVRHVMPWGRLRLGLAGGTLVFACVAAAGVVRIAHDADLVPSARPRDRAIASWLDAVPTPTHVLATFRFRQDVWARVDADVHLEGIHFATPARLQDATGDVWVDWRAGRFTLLRRPVLAHAMARSAFLLLTGPHRFGPAALAQWLDSNGESVGVPPIASAGSIAAVSWARLYRIRGAAVAGIPTLITTSALARLSDPVVRRLGSVVITGSASAVMAAQGRVRVLTGVVPAAMVSPR